MDNASTHGTHIINYGTVMFTGIIETMGTIAAFRPAAGGGRMEIRADRALSSTKIGDSIAVNGACLTAVELSGAVFSVDVSPETMMRSTLGNAKSGTRVNLERALRLSDRLDGHLVTGHIDGQGIIKYIKDQGNILVVGCSVEKALARYLIKKGSVAIDGISLTINACDQNNFEVTIIPHTAKITTIGIKKAGDAVNIETDIIGKYVEKFITGNEYTEGGSMAKSGIDMEMLAKNGFL
jgi:riboflavin synthase